MSQQAMLDASALLAQLYLDKEGAQRRIAEMMAQRDVRRQDRARLAQQAQTVRTEWRAQQEQAHACELRAKDLQHQRDTSVDRLREDYQVDLAELGRAEPRDGPDGRITGPSRGSARRDRRSAVEAASGG